MIVVFLSCFCFCFKIQPNKSTKKKEKNLSKFSNIWNFIGRRHFESSKSSPNIIINETVCSTLTDWFSWILKSWLWTTTTFNIYIYIYMYVYILASLLSWDDGNGRMWRQVEGIFLKYLYYNGYSVPFCFSIRGRILLVSSSFPFPSPSPFSLLMVKEPLLETSIFHARTEEAGVLWYSSQAHSFLIKNEANNSKSRWIGKKGSKKKHHLLILIIASISIIYIYIYFFLLFIFFNGTYFSICFLLWKECVFTRPPLIELGSSSRTFINS